MSDAGGSSSQDEGNRPDTGSPVRERLKAFQGQDQGEKKQPQTTIQRRGKRVDDTEKYNKKLEGQLERAIQEKEAAMKQLEEVISSKPTMSETDMAEIERLRKHTDLLESQVAKYDATVAESIRLEGRVKHLETQLDKAKAEIEDQKEKVQHEEKTSSDYRNLLNAANKKTPELENKYRSLSNAFERQREDFDTKEKRFEQRIKTLQTKYETQTEENKTLDAAKKHAEIHNANLEAQVQTLASNLQEAESRLEQSQKDVRDIVEKAQSARETSPSITGGDGGAAAVGGQKSLLSELGDDAGSPEGSVASIEDSALELATKALDELQQKASGLEADKTKLRGEVAGLQKEVDVLKGERNGLQKKVSELREENDRVQKQNEDLTGERDGLQTKASGLEQSNDKLQDEVAGLKKDGLQKKAADLTDDAGKPESELQGEKDRLQKQISELQEDNARLQKKASESTNNASKLESELQEEKDRLQEQISQLQEENSGLQKKASELTNNTSELKSALQEEKDRLQKQVSQLQEENSRLQDRASELGNEAGKLEGDLKAENDRLHKQVADLEAEREEIRKTVAELTDETTQHHAESQAERKKLREEVADMQKQNQELQDEASSLNSSVKRLQEELAESMKDVRQAEEDQDQRDEARKGLAAANDQLEAELEQAREDADRQQALIAALEAEKRNLQEQMDNSQEFDDRIGALQEERDNLQRELQKELDAKKKALDQAAKAQDPTSSEEVSDSYEKAVSDLLQAKADFADQIGALEESRKTILEELESVKQQLAAQPSAEEVAELRGRLQELQRERGRLVAEIARLEREKGEVEARLAARDDDNDDDAPVPQRNEYLDELRREIARGNEARARLEAERDAMLQQAMDVLQEKLDVEAQLRALEERARDDDDDDERQPAPEEDPETRAREIRDLWAQVNALQARNNALHAQLDESKARQDDYQKRYQELMDEERAGELELSKIRDAATASGTAGQSLDPADALRERIAALNERLEEARQGRYDARVPRPVTVGDGEEEPSGAGEPREPNTMVEQLQRDLAEVQRNQARQEAEVARRRERERKRARGKGKAREGLEMILESEPDEDEEDGGGGGGEPSKPNREEVLKRENQALRTRVHKLKQHRHHLDQEANKHRRASRSKDEQIENLQTLMGEQPPLPEGAPPDEGDDDDVLTVPRADLPGQVRERNRGSRTTFGAVARDVRRLLTYNGVIQVKNFVTQPKIALTFLYASIVLLLAVVMAEGHRYHQWAVANDVSRAMYVNRNWYIAFILPDFRFWEQLADMVKGLT